MRCRTMETIEVEVDPSEGGFDPERLDQLGAHYTATSTMVAFQERMCSLAVEGKWCITMSTVVVISNAHYQWRATRFIDFTL